jgi:hypothetical protein
MAEESTTQTQPYRRLAGRGRRTGGCVSVGAPISTIWLADDHLLLRESIYGLSETYKRFYFRDVQAIVIRRSPRWIAWISVWMILCLFFFACSVTSHWRVWVWPFFSALCFVLTTIQLARGPTCVTHLVTAVQRELLGSLNTLRKARRALKTLVPLIEEKQGRLDPAALGDSNTLPGQPSSAARPAVPSTGMERRAGAADSLVVASQLSRLSLPHLLLFAATLAGGGAALWEFFRPSPASLVSAALLLAAIIILSVVALVAQGRRRINMAVSSLTWTIMVGYIVAWLIIYTFYSSMNAFQRNARRVDANHPPQLFSDLSASELRQMRGFDNVLLFYGGCSIGLGVVGLGTLLFRRDRVPQPPPLPSGGTTGS